MRATAGVDRSSSSNPGCTATARSAKRRTASNEPASVASSVGTGIGCSANRCSPAIWSGTRLVARTERPGERSSNSPTTAAASTTCSMLSSTNSNRRSRRCPCSASAVSCPGSRRTLSAAAISGSTTAGSVTALRSTRNAPSANRSNICEATWIASLVLPAPPGPTSVTNRPSPSISSSRATSSARPTNEVRSVGRLVGRASSVRSCAKSEGKPGITDRGAATGSGKSLRR